MKVAKQVSRVGTHILSNDIYFRCSGILGEAIEPLAQPLGPSNSKLLYYSHVLDINMSSTAEDHHIALEPVNQQDVSPSKPHVETSENIHNDPRKFVIGSKGGDVVLELINDVDDLLEPFTAEEERKVIRKVDRLILPYLALCYVFFFVCYCPA